MRKILAVSAALLIGASAFAQVQSEPGHYRDDGWDFLSRYNRAHAEITFNADLPNQVKFELPQAEFVIDTNHLVPNNTVSINIRIRNTSDRAISIKDANWTGAASNILGTGFGIVSPTITIAAGAEGWFTYQVTIGSEEELGAALLALSFIPSIPGVYSYDGDVLQITTALDATGVFEDSSSSSVTFNFEND